MFPRYYHLLIANTTLLFLVCTFSFCLPQNQPVLAETQTFTDIKTQAQNFYQAGLQQYQNSQYQQALPLFQQALSLIKQIQEPGLEGEILYAIGDCYRNLSNYQQANLYYQQALPNLQKAGNQVGEAITLYSLGVANQYLGEYQKAINFLEKALIIHQQTGDILKQTLTLNMMGKVSSLLGDNEKAIQYLEKSLEKSKQIDNKTLEGETLNNIAAIYEEQGKYEKALEFLQGALDNFQKAGEQYKQTRIRANIGEVYLRLGQYQKAQEFLEEALASLQLMADKNSEANVLNNLAALYSLYQNQHQKALETLQKALAIYQQTGNIPQQAIMLNNIGQMYQNLNQQQKALEVFQQALTLNQTQSQKATTLNNIAGVYRDLKDFQKALEYYQKALAITQQIGDRPSESTILVNIGATLLDQRQIKPAIEKLYSAITLRESLRPGLSDANKISLFDTQTSPYRYLQQALIYQNQINQALEISERARARAFVELLATRLNSQSEQQLPNLQPIKIEQIKQLASQEKATIIEYSIMWNQLYIWVIQPNGNITFRYTDFSNLGLSLSEIAENTRVAAARLRGGEPKNLALTEFVRGTRESLAKPPAVSTANKLQQSYQLLIQPIEDLLPINPEEHIIFIPHESLFLVPFAALQDPNGKYLIEKHTIRIAPSIQALDLIHRQPTTTATEILIVGNPKMPEKLPLSPLPASEKEANQIAQLFNIQPLTGTSATETEIIKKMPLSKIIHLATHGLLEEDLSEQLKGVPGAVVFASSNTDDGLLTSPEIFNLKLNADLVVLSACNTGRGNITGDGVIGLSRSFMSAGVKSLIVSLWYIPDTPTSELMIEFYQNYQKNPDKAKALRSAMITIMQKYPKPTNWAAFTLIGD